MNKPDERFRKETNFRDIGGYPSAYNGTVKRGVFFRSGAPGLFLAEEIEALKDLGIRTVIDLRAPRRVKKLPDPRTEGIRIIEVCAGFGNILEDLNYSFRELWGMIVDEDQHGNLVSRLVASYFSALAYSNEAYRILFREILEGNTPILVHCSQGKDRTGIAAILILLALGVPEKHILEDYLLTNEYRKDFIENRIKRRGILPKISKNYRTFLTAIEGSLPESAHMFMAEIQERYDTYENFFEKEYGLTAKDLGTLRKMYLDPETE